MVKRTALVLAAAALPFLGCPPPAPRSPAEPSPQVASGLDAAAAQTTGRETPIAGGEVAPVPGAVRIVCDGDSCELKEPGEPVRRAIRIAGDDVDGDGVPDLLLSCPEECGNWGECPRGVWRASADGYVPLVEPDYDVDLAVAWSGVWEPATGGEPPGGALFRDLVEVLRLEEEDGSSWALRVLRWTGSGYAGGPAVGPAAAPVAGTPLVLDEDPCSTPGLPALAEQGSVAVVRCRSEYDGSQEAWFEVHRLGSEGPILEFPIGGTDGEGNPRPAAAELRGERRRAESLLADDGYAPLIPLPSAFGAGADGMLEIAVAPWGWLEWRAEDGAVRLRTAGPGEARVVSLPTFDGTGPCCGDWQNLDATCGRRPMISAAWSDARGEVVVLALHENSGPDGCEAGPRFVVLPGPGVR